MKTTLSTWRVAVVFGLACVSAASALEVRLQALESAQVARSAGWITSGIPFARGAVPDVRRLAVSVNGKPAPAQFLTTVSWEDGSARWVLMDVQAAAAASGKVDLVVSDTVANPAPKSPVVVNSGAETVSVSTGPLRFVISRKGGGLFQSLQVDGRELVDAAGRGLVLVKDDGTEVVAGAPDSVTVEQAGPMRALICIHGKFAGVHNDLLSYTVRIRACAGEKQLQVHAWLENNGAWGYDAYEKHPPRMEWFAFKGFAVELGLALGGNRKVACEGAVSDGNLKVVQRCSKGARWKWDFDYTISSGSNVLQSGKTTDGVMTIAGDAGRLTVAVRNFWQNFDKTLEVDGARVKVWLWPLEGQWPRYIPFDGRDDLNGQEQYGAHEPGMQPRKGLSLLPGGTHKGHRLVLDFSGRDPRETEAELVSPLFALAPGSYYAATEAVPGLFGAPDVKTGNSECDRKLRAWGRMAQNAVDPANATSLFKVREFNHAAFTYGWMDFGDLLVGGRQSSLSGDWPYVMLLDALRTGNPAFLKLGGEMVEHRIDIDQQWSERDDPVAGRRLQRAGGYLLWHGGPTYAQPGVSDNWIAGPALHYLLTGEPKALACCQVDADTLLALPPKTYGGNMRANAGAMNAFCAMYKLTSDKKWLKGALDLFNANVVPKWKALGPLLHDPNDQFRSQDYQKEDQQYCHAIATFCELHQLTGDATVYQLLKEGADTTKKNSYYAAALFASDLYAYVGLREKDPAYLARAAESFAEGFPISKSPSVFLPNNKNWAQQAVTTLRAGHVLQYAFARANLAEAAPGK
jgi:hypothetical protein